MDHWSKSSARVSQQRAADLILKLCPVQLKCRQHAITSETIRKRCKLELFSVAWRLNDMMSLTSH